MRTSKLLEHSSLSDIGVGGCLSCIRTLKSGLKVSIFGIEGSERVPLVIDNDCELFYFTCVLQGRIEVARRGRVYPVSARDLHTGFMPGERLRFQCLPGYLSAEVMVPPELLIAYSEAHYEKIDRDMRADSKPQPCRSSLAVLQAAELLAQRVMRSTGQDELLTEAAALELLGQVLAQLWPDGSKPVRSPRHTRQLHQARDRLLADLSQPPTITQLAREVGLNQSDLKRGFRETFGTSVYALFQKARMEHGRRLLDHNSVTATAMQLGYSNISHFSATFRNHFGVLPSELRRARRISG